MHHIVPDIHGQAEKLEGLLSFLGWRRTTAGWRGPEPERRLIFLGDFIDRGPGNGRVIRTVRSLVDSGKADAVMGNHEFNAIHYHTVVDGAPLRDHNSKNSDQHRAFLDEFPPGAAQTAEVIDWFKTLPLYIEADGLRAVHACWTPQHIGVLAAELVDRRIEDEMLHRPDWKEGELWEALQVVTSGIEATLPRGYAFFDSSGRERREVRIGWWLEGANTWREAARSVPDPSSLPEGEFDPAVAAYIYADGTPVFFGHYWLTGAPVVEAPHALCLDYSAGKDGPLLAYELNDPRQPVSVENIVNIGSCTEGPRKLH